MKKFLFLFFVFFLIAGPCPTAQADLATNKVDINVASLEELKTLTGIGEVKAQAIIDTRPFSSVDELINVNGIGEKTLQKIKEQGLACINCQTHQTIPEPAPELIQEPAKNYPFGIFINEILPSAKGADEENEWIELYNSNSFNVDLSGWKIQDSVGTQTVFVAPKNTIIFANGFLVFKRPETRITLNNDEDTISLLAPDGTIFDSASYAKAVLNQSYNKTGSGWTWSTSPTPGAINIITTIQPKGGEKGLPKNEISDTNNTIEAGLADINQGINLNQDINKVNPWFLFFIALAITIISALAVLFIKLRLKKENVRT